MHKKVSFLLVLIFILAIGLNKIRGSENTPSPYDRSITHITGTDAFSRKINPVASFREDRYVGIFYFAWHNAEQHKVFDITQLLIHHPDELWVNDPTNPISPRANYYFNEPLYGYYNSSDPWVIRKHIELFIAANIDFMAYDFTNSRIYWDHLYTMLDLLLEYKEAGWKVPQVMFFTKRNCETLTNQLYDELYTNEKYDGIWFTGSTNKPYIIGEPNDIPEKYHDYFNIRYAFWPSDEFRDDGWPYVDFVRPQRLFTNLMSVSVGQHKGGAFSWSVNGPTSKKDKPSWGRGYTLDKPINGDVLAIERGDNFQDQWDHAIKSDPEMIFITGWNEWIAGKFFPDESQASYEYIPYWVDTFNTEFSRDAEMTRSSAYVFDDEGKTLEEGYGDNFYMQMCENIRKYKGIPISKENYEAPVSKTIDISKGPSQWEDVSNIYLTHASQKIERKFIGFIPRINYKQALAENIVKEIRLTHDESKVYFYIKTENPITSYQGKSNWMNLFIGVDSSKEASWEHFHYVINREVSKDTTSLERFTGDYNKGEKIADLRYSVDGNIMQIEISKDDLKLPKDFSIYFKVTDSIEKEDDILDYYVSGESVPLGRLSYSYTASFEATKTGDKSTYNNTLRWISLILGTGIIIGCIILLGTKKRA